MQLHYMVKILFDYIKVLSWRLYREHFTTLMTDITVELLVHVYTHYSRGLHNVHYVFALVTQGIVILNMTLTQ